MNLMASMAIAEIEAAGATCKKCGKIKSACACGMKAAVRVEPVNADEVDAGGPGSGRHPYGGFGQKQVHSNLKSAHMSLKQAGYKKIGVSEGGVHMYQHADGHTAFVKPGASSSSPAKVSIRRVGKSSGAVKKIKM